MDGEDGEAATAARDAFQTLCNDTCERANFQCCHDMLVDHTEERRFDRSYRERQSEAVGTQLAKEREQHEPIVKAFVADSHVDG